MFNLWIIRRASKRRRAGQGSQLFIDRQTGCLGTDLWRRYGSAQDRVERLSSALRGGKHFSLCESSAHTFTSVPKQIIIFQALNCLEKYYMVKLKATLCIYNIYIIYICMYIYVIYA